MSRSSIGCGWAARVVAIGFGLVLLTQPALAGGGNVMPANAKPHGWSLLDIANAMPYFSASGNNPALLPDTPFQLLYISPTNTFTVKTGTSFFVPVFFVDDSPPILGTFPTSAADLADYYFAEDQLGVDVAQIIVDGQVTDLGPDYVAGIVNAPGLPDGGGSHYTQLGAFLTPLSKGTHTVTIRIFADGDAWIPFGGSFGPFEVTYTVIVK
jgi:hypothetical protein